MIHKPQTVHDMPGMAVRVIRRHLPEPVTPEALIMFSVFVQAVQDANAFAGETDLPSYCVDARLYINGPMPHLAATGIDVSWAKKVLQIGNALRPPPASHRHQYRRAIEKLTPAQAKKIDNDHFHSLPFTKRNHLVMDMLTKQSRGADGRAS